MRFKIAVLGSSDSDVEEEVRAKAYEVGEEIARNGSILLTGSGHGLPYEAAKGAKKAGGFTIVSLLL